MNSDPVPCIKTTAGILPSQATQATINERCTRRLDYVFSNKLSAVGKVYQGLVIVSDWRNSLPASFNTGQEAELSIGLTYQDPGANPKFAVSSAQWFNIGSQYHSQVIDLDSRPFWGDYAIIGFKCNMATPNCKQTTIHMVLIIHASIQPRSDFVENQNHPGGLDHILPQYFNINCAPQFRVGIVCGNYLMDDSSTSEKRILIDVVDDTIIGRIRIFPAIRFDSDSQNTIADTASSDIEVYYHQTQSLSYKDDEIADTEGVLKWERENTSTIGQQFWQKYAVTFYQPENASLKSSLLKFTPYDPAKFEIAGLLVSKIGVKCAYAGTCAQNHCVYLAQGPTNELSITHSMSNTSGTQFYWMITLPELCLQYFTVETDLTEDVDGLISMTVDTKTADGTLKNTLLFSFTISDNGNAAKARTRTINFGVRIKHTKNTEWTWQMLRTLQYTNPCDTASFFGKTLASEILQHTPGKYDQHSDDLVPFFPDKVTDVDCKIARQYEIQAASPTVNWTTYKFSTDVPTMLLTALSSDQKTEIDSEAIVTIKLVIGVQKDVIDTITGKLAFNISCNKSSAITFVSGETTKMEISLQSSAQTFRWLFQSTKHCAQFIQSRVGTKQDTDGLVSAIPSTLSVVNEPGSSEMVQHIFDFTVSSDNDPKKAISKEFRCYVRFKHIASNNVIHLYSRQINYSNECDTTDFFTAIDDPAAPIFTFNHVLGLGAADKKEKNLGEILTDKVGGNLCDGARVYTLVAQPNGIGFETLSFLSGGKLVSQLLTTQTTEFDIELQIDVKLVIGSGNNIRQAQTAIVQVIGKTCRMRSKTESYTNEIVSVQIGQLKQVFKKPKWKWDTTLCTQNRKELLFLNVIDNSLIGRATNEGLQNGNLPSGAKLSKNTEFRVDIKVTKDMVLLPNYKEEYIVKFQVSHWNIATDTIVQTVSDQFTVKYIDQCNDSSKNTIISFSPVINQISTSVLRAKTEYQTAQSIPDLQQHFTEAARSNLLFDDKTKWNKLICGSIQITLQHEMTQTEGFVKFDEALQSLKVEPTFNSEIGSYNVYLKMTYTDPDYSAISKTESFQITVLPCEIKSIETTSDFENPYEYTIVRDTKTMVTISTKLFNFAPDCSYADSYAWSVQPALKSRQDQFYSASSSSDIVGIQTENLANEGDYLFTYTLKKVGYAAASGISSTTQSFTVRLINPCRDTDLKRAFKKLDLYNMIGQATKNFEFLDLQDSTSEELDDAAAANYGRLLCGQRSYDLELVTTKDKTMRDDAGIGAKYDFINVETRQTGQIKIKLSFGSTKLKDAGFYRLYLHSYLQDYTFVQHYQLFTLTLFRQLVDLSIEDRIYTLQSESLSISVPQPRFKPELHQSNNTSTGANGAVILLSIDLISDQVLQPATKSTELLTLDAKSNQILIWSDDKSFVGTHQIIVTFTFQDYLEGCSIKTQFNLFVFPSGVDQNPFSELAKPLFDLTDIDLRQQVDVGQPWRFTLPPAAPHPDGAAFAVTYSEVQLGSAEIFVDYDSNTQQLSIEPLATTENLAGYYAITMKLKDQKGVESDIEVLSLEIVSKQIVSQSSDEQDQTSTIDELIGLKFAEILKKRYDQQLGQQNGNNNKVPIAKIESISSTGNVRIAFSKPLKIRDGISIDWQQLRALSVKFSGSQFIQVEMIPGIDSQPENLDFTWQMEEFAGNYMSIQLDFVQPLSISSQGVRDEIKISFKKYSAILVDEYGLSLDNDITLIKKVPKQFSDKATKEILDFTISILESSQQVALLLNFLTNFLSASSLQYVWDMINAQQIVSLTSLFNMNLPANAMIFFGWLIKIAAMEALPTDWIYSHVTDIEGLPLTPAFEELGLEHHLILNNFGTLGFSIAILPLIYLGIFLASFCNCCDCWTRNRKRWQKDFYWGVLIRLIIESYVIGLLCALINMKSLDLSSETDSWTFINSVIALFVLSVVTIFPIVSIYCMAKNRKSLKNWKLQKKYGTVIDGYKMEDIFVISYWSLEYARKACLALVVVYAQKQFWLQMLTLIMTSLFLIVGLGYIDVRTSKFDRMMDIFNEAKLIVIMYHMILFTDFLPDPEAQCQVGISVSVVLVIGTAINMIMLVVQPFKRAVRYFSLKKANKKAKQARDKKLFKKIAKNFSKRRVSRFTKQQQLAKQTLSDLQVLREKKREDRIIHEEMAQQQSESEERSSDVHQQSQKRHRRPKITDQLEESEQEELSDQSCTSSNEQDISAVSEEAALQEKLSWQYHYDQWSYFEIEISDSEQIPSYEDFEMNDQKVINQPDSIKVSEEVKVTDEEEIKEEEMDFVGDIYFQQRQKNILTKNRVAPAPNESSNDDNKNNRLARQSTFILKVDELFPQIHMNRTILTIEEEFDNLPDL